MINKRNTKIIILSYNILAYNSVMVQTACQPMLVDCDPQTWCMDLDQVEAAITPRTRAIMPVHMFGHPVDMRRVMKIAARHDLRVVEDAAEAHGAEVEGRRVGSFGDMACYSFYANK